MADTSNRKVKIELHINDCAYLLGLLRGYEEKVKEGTSSKLQDHFHMNMIMRIRNQIALAYAAAHESEGTDADSRLPSGPSETLKS